MQVAVKVLVEIRRLFVHVVLKRVKVFVLVVVTARGVTVFTLEAVADGTVKVLVGFLVEVICKVEVEVLVTIGVTVMLNVAVGAIVTVTCGPTSRYRSGNQVSNGNGVWQKPSSPRSQPLRAQTTEKCVVIG